MSGATSTLVLGAIDRTPVRVLGGQTIASFGLEPVTTSVTAADVVIDLPNTSNTAILEVDPGDATKLCIPGGLRDDLVRHPDCHGHGQLRRWGRRTDDR